jgi:hypothetical protein
MLGREEYIEQAHLFRTLVERIKDNIPLQDLLSTAHHELLATTKLPLAVSFLLAELKHTGGFGTAMDRLKHYFTPFQTFVVQQAEDDRGRFDLRVALSVLWKEAEYRAQGATPQGIFLYQFETLCRNRLNYDRGLAAMAQDPIFDSVWRDWILIVRRQIGLVDLADLIYVRSEFYAARHRKETAEGRRDELELREPLFGEKEGRIAWGTRRKDPLYLLAALQRQLGYPAVPRQEPPDTVSYLLPQMVRRMERLELRVKLLEEEQKGGIDITKFYQGQQKPG